MIELTVKPAPGAFLDVTCIEAIRIAKILNVVVHFEFNNVSLFAWPSTEVDILINIYCDRTGKYNDRYKAI
jgi:hypothetical protein